MEGFRCDEDLGFFLEKPLDQLCFGLYQLALNFGGGVSLYIESSVILKQKDGEEFEFSSPYTGAGRLLSVLGAEVVEARAEADGGLSLEFSDESALFVANDKSEYESYQILNGSSQIIV